MYQGRMLYPRGHARQGQAHPWLYAGAQHGRTRAHQYFGTQPTPYGVGGSGRTRGASGRPETVLPYMLYSSGYRPHRPQRSMNFISRRITTAGHQQKYELARLGREYRKSRSESRRDLQRNLEERRNQIRGLNQNGHGRHAKKSIRTLREEMSDLRRKSREDSKGLRKDYQTYRRATTYHNPMYAAVYRSGGRNIGWRPSGRRSRSGDFYAQRGRLWGYQDYRGGGLYNRYSRYIKPRWSGRRRLYA